MLTTVIALIALAAAVLAVVLGSVSIWTGLLVFALCFIGGVIVFALVLVISTLSVDNTKPIEKISPLCRRCCDGVATLLCDLGRLKAKVSGLEKLPEKERFLIVSNHSSAADPMIAAHLLKKYDIAFISKPSNMALPFLGKMAYGTGFLAIDRENDRNALKTIITAANYLKRDICSMCIYPEGTRSRDGELLPFHAGSFKIAQKAGAPVAVACTVGTENVKRNLFRLSPSKLRLDILELIPKEKVQEMSTVELADYSRGLIAGHLAQFDKEAAEK